MKPIVIWLSLAWALGMGTLSVQAEAPIFEFAGAAAETYKVASGDDLQIYIFNPPDHEPARDSRPAIVFFFGGGWVGGTPGQFEQHCRFLASRGMVAMTADYRVKSRQKTGPQACVADGKSAIRWIRTHAKRLGVDPQRVVAGGGSAGGHVATATGMVNGFEEPAEDMLVSSKPNALVLFNPVYDNGPTGWGYEQVQGYWPEFSPAHNITHDDPPAVVFLGTDDPLIPLSTAEKFQADMRKVGLKSELHLYEGQPHGFFNQSKGGAHIFLDTLRKMDAFLSDLGYLSGQPSEAQFTAVLQPERPLKNEADSPVESPTRAGSTPATSLPTLRDATITGLEKVRPNFVIIMADDLGYGDLGCFGHKQILTPNIDALAQQGMKFTDYHSNGAVCSPTRAALMTGRYQQRSGIGGVVSAANHRHTGLGVQETTFADVLRENGYATAIYGKWHLGYSPSFNPIHQGFQQFIGYVSGNVDFFSHIDQAGYEDWWHQDRLTPEAGYTTHLINEHGVRFIRQQQHRPFCLYLPHEAPHYPYQGPNDSPIRELGNPNKLEGERTDIANAYREMIEELDKGVGQIVATLEELGLAENTLVFFCSDNGANQNGDNGGLRGFKGQVWEGGHRVPAVAYWPSVIAAGSTTHNTAMSMDLFPTMLDAAGITISDSLQLDGVSLMPLLSQGVDLPDRWLFWDVGQGLAARFADWKLVVQHGRPNQNAKRKSESSLQLYNLSKDRGETTPVDDENRLNKMKAALDAWLASWADVDQRS